MLMFLPFLIFLVAFILTVRGDKKVALYLWIAGVVVNIAVFKYHVTDPLNLNF